MLLDLLSSSNMVTYNCKIAQLFGLNTAIYLSELMSINDKAIKKNKLSDKYFDLKREYITERTTLSAEEQISIEKNLVKLGVLQKVDESSLMCVNIDTLLSIMGTTDKSLIDNVKKVSKTKNKRASKSECTKIALKASISVTNSELKQAYENWIDAVYDKQGWMSKTTVTVAEKTIDEFANHNLDIALKILEIATINGYRDIQWAISSYNKNYKFSYKPFTHTTKVVTKNEQLSSEVF